MPLLATAFIGAALLPAQALAEDALVPIDDGKLRQAFQGKAEAWISDSAIPRGATLLPAWEAKKASPARFWRASEADRRKSTSQFGAPELYEHAAPATLILGHLYQCGKCSRWHPSLAGGVVIDSSGIAATNFHVMKTAKAEVFGAMLRDGEVFPVVEVLAASEPDDLAVVRLQLPTGKKLPAVPLATVNDPPGTGVFVVSHPDGRFFTGSEGMIARHFIAPDTKAPRVHITADYARGSSGCGVFNFRGELTALVSSTQSIYYSEEKGIPRNLQMVLKSSIPVGSLRKLLDSAAQEPSSAPRHDSVTGCPVQ